MFKKHEVESLPYFLPSYHKVQEDHSDKRILAPHGWKESKINEQFLQ